MPKEVHDLVDKLLADPDFYPKKSKKEQEAIAWAIAYSKKGKGDKKKKKASTEEFHAANTMITYGRTLESSSHYFESDALVKLAIDLIHDNSNNT
jgi:hypothetical protein